MAINNLSRNPREVISEITLESLIELIDTPTHE